MATISQLLSELLDMFESALQPGGPLLPALAVTPAITARATTALARATADRAAPGRVTGLRTTYEAAFGFDNGIRRGAPDNCIWEPWQGLIQTDFEAVIAVAEVLGMPPEHVLGLWLQEGKHAHDSTVHGSPHPIPNVFFATSVTSAQLRSWLRSVVLYQAFGSDAFTSFTRVPGQDNVLNGADHDHDASFVAGLSRLRAANVPGTSQFTDTDARRYFASTQGALRDLVMENLAGAPVAATLAAGETIDGSVRLRSTSIASWVYLQAALFAVYRRDMEARFIAEYGPPMDLSTTPWVTYVGWNGGINSQYAARFSRRPLGETPEERIAQLFDPPPANLLTAAERTLYYAVPVSTSALANAIQLKYLIDAVTPWFGPPP